MYYLRDLRGKASKIKEKRDGVEGYGDGITSTPVVETEVISEPEQVAEVSAESSTEVPEVEAPVTEAAAPEAADAEEAK